MFVNGWWMDGWKKKTSVEDPLCETLHRSLSSMLSENELWRFTSHAGNRHSWRPGEELGQRVDKVQCKACSITLLLRDGPGSHCQFLWKIPQVGDGQGSLKMAASSLITPSTNTRAHTHTQEYPGISSCLQSLTLPKSNPHSHIHIFNPITCNQAFQIPVKKPTETNSKRGLLLLQRSPPAPLGSRLQLQALCLSAVLFLP